jgi:hypothetical protein
MTTHYKVWLDIEEIDEDRDHYQTVYTPCGSTATFHTYEEACAFVEHADALLSGDFSSAAIHQELLTACKLAVQCLNAIPNTRTHVGRSYEVIHRIEQAINHAERRLS